MTGRSFREPPSSLLDGADAPLNSVHLNLHLPFVFRQRRLGASLLMSKTFAVLGAGMQGTAAAYDLAKFAQPHKILMGDVSLDQANKSAWRVNDLVGSAVCEPHAVNALDPANLAAFLKDVDVVGGGNAKQIVGALMIQGSLNGDSNVNGNVKLLYSSAMISKLNSLTQYEISSWIDQ